MTDLDKKLYELFARKELSEGCKFKYPNKWDDDILTVCSLYDDTGNSKTLSFLPPDKESTWEINYFTENTEIEILGHEPHLHDVFRVAKEKNIASMILYAPQNILKLSIQGGFNNDFNAHRIAYNPTLPLLSQSDETKSQLISLFS